MITGTVSGRQEILPMYSEAELLSWYLEVRSGKCGGPTEHITLFLSVLVVSDEVVVSDDTPGPPYRVSMTPYDVFCPSSC